MILLSPLFFLSSANAQFATTGSGLYKNNIFWIDWGNNSDILTSGKTVTSGFNIGSPATAANRLDITCKIEAISVSAGSLSVYTPGTWSGDALESLYKKTATGSSANTLSIGISNTSLGASGSFTTSCTATLGGANFNLAGLVFAEAEQSSAAEFVGTVVSSAVNVRVIDGFSTCTDKSSTIAKTNFGATTEYLFRNTTGQCAIGRGPSLVGYLENTNTSRFIIKGEGKSAIAIGVMVDLDFSEALASSYGVATHSMIPAWSGGLAVPGVSFNDNTKWADRTNPIIKLGTSVALDTTPSNPVGSGDVDGLSKKIVGGVSGFAVAPIPVPNTTYTIPSVSCAGPAKVNAWIDFNGNGSFDSSEKSSVASCAAGSGTVNLVWSVPAVGSGYKNQSSTALRIRIASLESDITSPIGSANSGEVEDYFLALGVINLELKKTWSGGISGDKVNIQATTGFTSANTSAFTSTNSSNNSTFSNSIVLAPNETGVLPVESFTVSAAANSYADTSWKCSDGTNPVVTVAQGGNFTTSADSIAKTVTCTLNNTAITSAGSKTANPASGQTVKTGDEITYTLKVTVAGGALKSPVVLTDTMSAGLTLVSSTLPSGCVINLQLITCTLPTGTTAGDHTFIYKAKVNNNASLEVTPSVINKLELNNGTCDNCESVHPFRTTAVIATKKVASPATNTSVKVGDSITFNLETVVSIRATEEELVLTDTFTSGLTLYGAIPAGCTTQTLQIICKLPANTPIGTYRFTYTAIVNEAAFDNQEGVLNSVVANLGDCSPCKTQHELVTSTTTNIVTSKTSQPVAGSFVKPGDDITYTLKTVVTGAPVIAEVILKDTLGEGLTLVGQLPEGCTIRGQVITCVLGIGQPIGVYNFVYKAQVNETSISEGVKNSVVSNIGTCTECSVIHDVAEVETFKRVSGVNRKGGKGVFTGDQLNFDVTVIVKGGRLNKDLVLKDQLSAGLILKTIPSGCSGKNRNLTCTLPEGTTAGTYHFKYSATVTSNAGNVVGNKVVPDRGSCAKGCETQTKVIHTVVLRVTKTSNIQVVKLGDFVRYKVLIENLSDENAEEFFVFDTPAQGLTLVESSIKVVGDDVWGLSQTFPLVISGLDVAAHSKISIEYLMRVSAGAGRGDLCNKANANDNLSVVSSNEAKVCVSRQADPDFELTRILGTVFEDQNGNGIQEEDEAGLPGVRLLTATGLKIETDSQGRYHIDAIDPGVWSRGRNYIVLLDPTSLTGEVQFTTQNPLVKRITWAVPAQFNFGVRQRLAKFTAYDAVKQADIPLTTMPISSTNKQVDLMMSSDNPQSPVVQTPLYSFKGDGLFNFDKFELKDIVHPGLANLKHFAERLKTDFQEIENITIKAHTDQLGTDEYNQKLSQKRAQTIKKFFEDAGVRAKRTEVKAIGSKEPVVDCPNGKSDVLIDCLSPNRRFEIQVSGKTRIATKTQP